MPAAGNSRRPLNQEEKDALELIASIIIPINPNNMEQIADDEALKRCFEAVLGLRRNY